MKSVRMMAAVLAMFSLLAAGCASSRSGEVYTRDQARQSMSVYYGTVLTVKNVQIEGTKSPAGTLMGGAAGAVAGNAVGGGSGRAIATVVGGIAGALAGGAIEEGVTRKAGLEITVELDNGQIMAIVQEADDQYVVGDRVRILRSNDGTTRVRQ
ncbi:glycine zipper 2TM domain-containing protein [Desulfonema ishimotonii]|uniref:Glycine zipper 2TM domain-containing protein n=1 Tax=Desulfonema ishimotonii TaxID=45657 RepID=A0A401G3Y1_9BACT|nr:glycine zipper 2TM domain-containing protein [Desulfonema ishimotonii]GBC63947.1 glycine zipper 2TM domain-containing protein [Desulfonema ishimotonii]